MKPSQVPSRLNLPERLTTNILAAEQFLGPAETHSIWMHLVFDLAMQIEDLFLLIHVKMLI